MSTFDIILLIVFGSFVVTGFWAGLIQSIGSLIGLVVGSYAASRLYDDIGAFFQFFLVKQAVANLLAFILVFVATGKLIGFVMYRVQKAFKVISFIPLVGLANRLAGAALGVLEGAIVLGVALMFASQFFAGQHFGSVIESSQLAQTFIKVGKIMTPLIADALHRISL